MESRLLTRRHVQQAGILFLREVVNGFGMLIALLVICSLPVAVQQWLSVSQPFEGGSATAFQVS